MEEKITVCVSCSKKVLCYFGPDPYAEEVCGDETPLWECKICREESAWEI